MHPKDVMPESSLLDKAAVSIKRSALYLNSLLSSFQHNAATATHAGTREALKMKQTLDPIIQGITELSGSVLAIVAPVAQVTGNDELARFHDKISDIYQSGITYELSSDTKATAIAEGLNQRSDNLPVEMVERGIEFSTRKNFPFTKKKKEKEKSSSSNKARRAYQDRRRVRKAKARK